MMYCNGNDMHASAASASHNIFVVASQEALMEPVDNTFFAAMTLWTSCPCSHHQPGSGAPPQREAGPSFAPYQFVVLAWPL
mmetsp:Transcript_15411/g.26974  ORF Transcript_15411/g.26974 Transcript_15411/m.26974 type:complete len:81 (-) Transcript_15411:1064-1306(-)